MNCYCILCGYEHECEVNAEGDSTWLMYCEIKEDYFILPKEVSDAEGNESEE